MLALAVAAGQLAWVQQQHGAVLPGQDIFYHFRPPTRPLQQLKCTTRVTEQVTAAATAAATAGPAAAAAEQQQDGKASSPEADPLPETLQLKVQVLRSIDQVTAGEWDALVAAQAEVNPFLKWAFLHALEASKSAVPEEGWGPQHVTVRDAASGVLLGACPLYLKGHSYGEYVFDSSWANYSHMMGKRYYPKLQACVPFTPVTGNRLLVQPGQLAATVLKALAQTLLTITDEMGVSSLHVTFPTGEEWAALGALGFQQRRGIQYHWENRGYSSFEDFLADLKQSKRKSIRQERKSIAKQGLTVRRLPGSEVTAGQWDTFHSFYQATVDKKWGSAYLTREFWHMLGSELGSEVMLVVAEQQGDTVAAALNLVGSHCVYGRNWGSVGGREFKNLHFEVCYYQAIEEAIARGLPRVEAGAQGEHKLQRGYLPNFTYSAHYMTDPTTRAAVAKFLDREEQQLAYTWQALTLEGSPFKQDKTVEYLVDKMSSYSSLSSLSSLSSSDEADAAPGRATGANSGSTDE
ncbi:hypothetical protein OEZ86_012714 [Tetradesmus obliquus]|nr:hypothetical protein OEZ86_012714 [Tetradesmus obliquus]